MSMFIQLSGIGFLITATVTLVLLFASRFLPFLQDTHQGLQKVHRGSVPRVGGVAIFAGLLVSFFLFSDRLLISEWVFIKLFFVAAIPAFGGGLLEDLTKQISPLARFILTLSSALLAYFILGAGISSFGVYWLDVFLQYKLVALCITALAVGGVANGTNMLDGFNGLLLSYSLFALLSFSWFSWHAQDSLLLLICMVLFCCCLGLFVFNWPKAKIFLGDGGSYTIGFFLAEIAVLLYVRNPWQVSPVALGVVLSLPVVETLFSIVRRRHKMFQADDQHLHQLIYAYLRQRFGATSEKNALVCLCLLPLAVLPMLIAVFFPNSGVLAIAGFVLFLTLYLCWYFLLKAKLKNR